MTNRYHNVEAFRRTVADMTADPEVTGDLLLVGIWLAGAAILNEPPRNTGQWKFSLVARDLFGSEDESGRVAAAIAEDAPDDRGTGGALARHIHGFMWERWWTRLKPGWSPPECVPVPTKPSLSLVTNDDFEPISDTTRADLRSVEGGWR